MNLELETVTHDTFKEKKNRKLITKFSDYGSSGSYDYLSQVILLNSIEKNHIDQLIEKSKTPNFDYYNIARTVLPLLNHEQTHWVDNTSTLWGFEFLEKIYESLSISTSKQTNGQSEYDFHKMKSLRDEILNIRHPKYYSTKGNSEGDRPWSYDYSVGKLFDVTGRPSEYPIFFTRFNDLNGNLISREPFTLCSLFESSATFQELMSELSLMDLLSGDELLVEQGRFTDKYLSRIYDKSLTEYSVAAHKLSNELKLSDIVETYGMSASLAHLSLNFHTDYFERLNPEVIYEKDHPFLDSIKICLAEKNRATLYYFLSDALSVEHKKTPVSRANLKTTINEILLKFDISLEEMNSAVEKKMTEIATTVCHKYHDDYACNLFLKGVGRYKKLGLMAEDIYPFDKLIAPGAILGDNYYLNPYNNFDTEYEERWLNHSFFLDKLNEFSEACIYYAQH